MAGNAAKREYSEFVKSGKTKLGAYAQSTANHHFGAGQPKCNSAFHDLAVKANVQPILLKNGKPANTAYILENRKSLSCWKETQKPKAGGMFVHKNANGRGGHMGVLTGSGGKAVSAGSRVMQERRHWAYDSKGIPRLSSQRDVSAGVDLSDRPRVHFFDYHCPDMVKKSEEQ